MNALAVTLAILATYRISRMIASEDGPFDMFATLRNRAGQKTWIGRGLHCTLCVSWWLAWVVALLVPVSDTREYILLALGVAGGAVVVGKFFG